MKRKHIVFALAALMAASGVSAKSFKRGVSENQFVFAGQMEPLKPGVSWYYNWANIPGNGYKGQVAGFEDFEFVPMVWNGNYSADNIREYVKSHPGCKYLLGFNEPNFTAQANMTPAQAAELWPAVVALAKELNLKLVAPALNYSPNPPYQDPVKWMDEFVALVGLDSFDHMALHNYGGFGVMKNLCTTFHDKYQKPIWVTEFCYWPNEGTGNSRVEPEAQIGSMVECVEWLEKTDWIYRYAWFKPVGAHENTATSSSPCYGLEITEAGDGLRTLSPQGYVYTYMSEFNPDVWNAVGTEVAATEYISSKGVALAPGLRKDAPKPIEVSRFNAGAWLDYQFNVPAAGKYQFQLCVTGVGEPVRFDPNIAMQLVKTDGTTEVLNPGGSFTLPGNETDYVTLSYDVELPAGHQTIRVVDQNPYQPSGLHISSVKLAEPAAINEIAAARAMTDGAVYGIDGRRMPAGNLPAGIYIKNGNKIIIH